MAVACPNFSPLSLSSVSQGTELRWYVLKVKPHKEAYVQIQLEAAAGVRTYCPLMKTPSRFRAKWQRAIEPVFPGYLFVEFDLTTQLLHIRRLQGHDALVHFGGRPASVPTPFIQEFRDREDRNGYIVFRPGRMLRSREPVRVVSGPFRGQTGVFLRYQTGAERVCLLLDFMNSHTLLELPVTAVEAAAI